MADLLRRRAEELFHDLADLSPGERRRRLDECCGDDASLRQEVETLLAADDSATFTTIDAGASATFIESERVGPYKLLQLIGEGGFGVVYMAEQEEPVRRRVALKIIKLGMDTREVIARFEAERQALAMMDHPNIARVLDAGATTAGRPFFVMELVRGVPITEYCDRNNLPVEQRLRLLVQVCRAVQHAHQKGIIHRDIKPSNVMVTLHDGEPVPKVIDFGIAKAMNQRLTSRTLFTDFRQFVGTPEYMSPEQAELSGLDVDTRSDLYSLGVLLYELLTSTTPFDAAKLRSATFPEVQQIIRETEPQRPSLRVSTLGDALEPVAKARHCDPRLLSRSLRGDLDWIVLKALEKDRTRRYETAADFAADIERYLDNQPITARPPSAAYKFQKFVRRHRGYVMGGAVVAAALLLGLGLATLGFLQAREERNRAVAAEELARHEASSARQQADRASREAEAARLINAFFTEMLAAVDPLQLRRQSAFAIDTPIQFETGAAVARDVSVAEMLRLAGENIDQAFADKPRLEADARHTIGVTLRGLGRYRDALPHLQRATALRDRLLGTDHADTLQSRLALGATLTDAGQTGEALPLLGRTYKQMAAEYGEEDARTLNCASILATALSDAGRLKEADSLFSVTLEQQRRVLGPDHRDTLSTMLAWSSAYFSQRRVAEGKALAREVYDRCLRTLPPSDSLRLLSQPLMGWWYFQEGHYEQAEALFRPGLANCRRILGDDHPFTYLAMQGLASSLNGPDEREERAALHAAALEGLERTRGKYHWQTRMTLSHMAQWALQQGQFREAERLYRTLVERIRELSGGESAAAQLSVLREFGGFLVRVGKTDEAIDVLHEQIAIVDQAEGESSPMALEYRAALARTLSRVGRIDDARLVTEGVLAASREHAERPDATAMDLNTYAWTLLTCEPPDMRDPETALDVVSRAIERGDELPTEQLALVYDTLALAYHLTGDNSRAVATQEEALALLAETQPGQTSVHLMLNAPLVRYLLEQGDTAAAEQRISEGIATYRAQVGDDNPQLAEYMERGASLVLESGHYSMAERLFREALSINERAFGPQHHRVARDYHLLGYVLYEQCHFEEAHAHFAKAAAISRDFFGTEHIDVAESLSSAGAALAALGRPAAAAANLQEAIDIYDTIGGGYVPSCIEARACLGRALVELGDVDAAEQLATVALHDARRTLGMQHPYTACTLATQGRVLLARGRPAEAIPLLQQAVSITRRVTDTSLATRRDLALLESVLGEGLLAEGAFEAAEALLLDSYTTITQMPHEEQPTILRPMLQRLVDLYTAWDRPDEAAKWEGQLVKIESATSG